MPGRITQAELATFVSGRCESRACAEVTLPARIAPEAPAKAGVGPLTALREYIHDSNFIDGLISGNPSHMARHVALSLSLVPVRKYIPLKIHR